MYSPIGWVATATVDNQLASGDASRWSRCALRTNHTETAITKPTPMVAAIRTGPSVATNASQPNMPSINSVAGTRTAALAITRPLVQGFRTGGFFVTVVPALPD
jgi:hypothetical protein